jgi:hypothetical protein
LEKIVKSKEAEQTFNFFLNRCCHILINRWQMSPLTQRAIPELVELLENLSPVRPGFCQTTNHLRQLVGNFAASEQYLALQRLSRVIGAKTAAKNNATVGILINRYPYLYDHCLLTEDSSQEYQKTVKKIKAQAERRFEINLSQYVTYKLRLAQLAQNAAPSFQSGRIIQPVENPTLLSDKDLNRSLRQFTGVVEGGYTYKSLSQNFLTHSVHTPNFQALKDDLYDYILSSVDSQYGKGHFNKKLYQMLQNTLPQCNGQKPSESLLLRATSQILNFLVVESAVKPDHYVFIDMITNLGVTRTIGLLLKLVLLCGKVKPYLEKRFAILFNHYESASQDGVPWLVKALEQVQIALSIHFGNLNLSGLKLAE